MVYNVILATLVAVGITDLGVSGLTLDALQTFRKSEYFKLLFKAERPSLGTCCIIIPAHFAVLQFFLSSSVPAALDFLFHLAGIILD